MSPEDSERLRVGTGIAQLGILAVISYLVTNEQTAAVIRQWQAEGRTSPTLRETADLDATSDAIHKETQEAIKLKEEEEKGDTVTVTEEGHPTTASQEEGT